MRQGIIIGWMLGICTFALGIGVSANWYEYRVITTATDTEWWIENKGCDVAGTDRIAYLRCPRLRLP